MTVCEVFPALPPHSPDQQASTPEHGEQIWAIQSGGAAGIEPSGGRESLCRPQPGAYTFRVVDTSIFGLWWTASNGKDVRQVSQCVRHDIAGILAIADSGGQAVLATTEAFRREAVRLVSRCVCKDWYHDRATYARRDAVLVTPVEVDLSQQRACGPMELNRATCWYRRQRGEGQRLRV